MIKMSEMGITMAEEEKENQSENEQEAAAPVEGIDDDAEYAFTKE